MSNMQIIWNYFIDKIGNAYGVAGLMGNIYAESEYYPDRVQGDIPYSSYSVEYTAQVDNGEISKNDFIYNAPGGGGYGLCQWTDAPRKKALYEMWKNDGYSSIGSMSLALAYLWYELQNDYSDCLTVLKNATSIREASDKILHDFENPADQSESVELERLEYSETAYNTCKDGVTNTYTPRLDSSGIDNNKWYYDLNPFYQAGYGLPNCTCYAWGRRGEITGKAPETSLGDAFRWWQYNIDNNIYPYGQVPKLGAIICWDYGTGSGGHVAVVEKINSDGSIVTSNSAYSGTFFYTQTLTKESNYCWRDGLIFQGFIYLNEEYEPGDTPPTTTTKNKNLSKLLLYAIGSEIF